MEEEGAAVSEGLLVKAFTKRSRDAHRLFQFGLGEWTESSEDEKENAQPSPRKKLKLTLEKLTLEKPKERWQFLSDIAENNLKKKYVPKNTSKATNWAHLNFTQWKSSRNRRFVSDPDKQVPSNLLECATSPGVISKWLALYIAETRKENGDCYPPKSLYALLAGLLRYCQSQNPACLNFLDTSDKRFYVLHNAMDNTFRQLRQSGAGSACKSAEAFSKKEENHLWESGVLGVHSSKVLLHTVFFLNGKNFCLRGGEEHRNLKLSQIKRYTNPDRYVYTENCSKNRAGGISQLRVANKVVPVYALPDVGFRCHVFILDTYFSKLSPEAFQRDTFYLQALSPSSPEKPWFSCTPVGRNTLGKIVKAVCLEGNIPGRKTNHSLRATGASTMFESGVPEKIIQQRTGHRSLEGVRHYEQITAQQQQAVCNILASEKRENFQLSVKKNIMQPSMCMNTPHTMKFACCNVNIYQGTAPPPAHSSGSNQATGMWDGFDIDAFFAD